MAHLPSGVLYYLMNYRFLQPKWFLERTEHFNFLHPTAPFQWWYFDFLLEDGSTLIVAFVPHQWWPSKEIPDVSAASLFVTLRDPAGVIRKWVWPLPYGDLRYARGRITVGDVFSIEKRSLEYCVLIRTEGVWGDLRVRHSARPFAASPFGRLPLWLLRMAGQKRRPISYASLVPRDHAHIRLAGDGFQVDQGAIAYHEQGRLGSAPHDLGRDGWIWFHIIGKEWGIFGVEDSFICIRGERVSIQYGFPIRTEKYCLSAKEYLDTDNRVLKAAVLEFVTPKVSLHVRFEPSHEEDLTYWPSSDNRQLWSIGYATARVRLEYRGKIHEFSAPALLETCRCR